MRRRREGKRTTLGLDHLPEVSISCRRTQLSSPSAVQEICLYLCRKIEFSVASAPYQSQELEPSGYPNGTGVAYIRAACPRTVTDSGARQVVKLILS